jgi:hypothetical protein
VDFPFIAACLIGKTRVRFSGATKAADIGWLRRYVLFCSDSRLFEIGDNVVVKIVVGVRIVDGVGFGHAIVVGVCEIRAVIVAFIGVVGGGDDLFLLWC